MRKLSFLLMLFLAIPNINSMDFSNLSGEQVFDGLDQNYQEILDLKTYSAKKVRDFLINIINAVNDLNAKPGKYKDHQKDIIKMYLENFVNKNQAGRSIIRYASNPNKILPAFSGINIEELRSLQKSFDKFINGLESKESIIDEISETFLMPEELTLQRKLLGVQNPETPLMQVAANEARIGELLELLKQGVDVNETDKKGNTALMWASLTGNGPAVVNLMMRSQNIDAAKKNNLGNNALIIAVKTDCLNCVRDILNNITREKAHAIINAKNNEGESALSVAEEKVTKYPDPARRGILSILQKHS